MAGIVLEDNCHLLLTQDPRFGSQADQQTDKESNPHGYNSIGTKYVDYGLGANPNPARERLFRKE
jgi:hypothetical protein